MRCSHRVRWPGGHCCWSWPGSPKRVRARGGGDPRAGRIWPRSQPSSGASRRHDPEPYGHVAGTRANDGARRPSPELFGQDESPGQERRAWDSNPRWVSPHSGFQDRRTRPLCEPSQQVDMPSDLRLYCFTTRPAGPPGGSWRPARATTCRMCVARARPCYGAFGRPETRGAHHARVRAERAPWRWRSGHGQPVVRGVPGGARGLRAERGPGPGRPGADGATPQSMRPQCAAAMDQDPLLFTTSQTSSPSRQPGPVVSGRG